MQVLCVLTLLVALVPVYQTTAPKPAAKPPAAAPAAAAKGGRTVELTGGDDMKYNTTTINAKPGEMLRVVLKSTGTIPKIAMAHNFVLLKKGVDAAKVSTASAAARATDFIATDQKSNLMAFTTLAGPGESVSVDFTVPSVPGQYEFICTFPGHFQAGMKGVLTVK